MIHLKKQIWVWLGGLIIVASFLFYFTQPKNLDSSWVEIGGTRINVEIADTPELRMQGLSLHRPLAENEGMLFIFEAPNRYSFWMKDMLFPIDIIWFTPSEVEGLVQIVDITRDARPESFPQTFRPKEPAQYVLEVNAGLAEKSGWQIGDEVILKTKNPPR